MRMAGPYWRPQGRSSREKFTQLFYGTLNRRWYQCDQLQTKEINPEEFAMITFQLIGLALTVLFFSPMISSRQRSVR